MDTVQNISDIIVQGGPGASGADSQHLHSQLPMVHPSIIGNPQMMPDQSDSRPQVGRPRSTRRPADRREFLSRPNWLFTHNENVLFCSALQHLRFTDQNNVPRKFIEEWFQDHMVSLDTLWPAGQRYLDESVKDMEKYPEKAKDRQSKELNTRRRNIYKNRRSALQLAEQRYRAAAPHEQQAALAALQAAQADASVPEAEIPVQEPDYREVALIELGIKIVRRLQGQTDRMDMAEDLAKEKFVDDPDNYFGTLLVEVEKAIYEKHNEIAVDRERVESKSKQSRKRRRQQVANGVTLSGSATRVRFTNREMAMLIHWIYTYPKNEWTQHIYEYYLTPHVSRSAEHVRDKMRDLVTRSRETEKGGLASMRVRSAGGFSTKPHESPEAQDLARNDVVDFKYPEGPLEPVPNGRYFNEERSEWVEGPLPMEYVGRYHEEVMRVMRVVRSKVDRTMSLPLPTVDPVQFREHQFDQQQLQAQQQLHEQQLQAQHAQHAQQRHLAPTSSLFDDAFVAQTQAQILHQQHGNAPQTAPPFGAEDDFSLVSIWNENNKDSQQDDAAAMAAAALKGTHDYFLESMDDKDIKRARHQ